MKLKIGNRLLSLREERKLSQTEMAELLHLSQSAYSRLERNETSMDMEQILKISEKLQIPVQDFLPETVTINNDNNDNGQVGLVIGNYYNYNYSDKALDIAEKDKEIQFLKEKITLLEDKIQGLEELIQVYKSPKD